MIYAGMTLDQVLLLETTNSAVHVNVGWIYIGVVFFFKVVLLACAPRRESWQARETLSRYVFYFKNL